MDKWMSNYCVGLHWIHIGQYMTASDFV